MKKISSLAITLLLALVTNFSFAQGQLLTGKIVSRDVDNLNKISITVKGLKIGTTTGEDGQFSLTLPSRPSKRPTFSHL